MLAFMAGTSAQRVEMDKKSGLITVDDKPSFYLIGKNRSIFLADYSLENLQHQELAYLKVLQQRIFTPGYGYGTETFYVANFPSGNFCELHGLTGFSMFKALAKNIAAARLVQNDIIDPQAEQRFVRMNGGEFAGNRDNRGRNDDYAQGGPGRDRNPNNDNRRYDRRDDRRGNDDGYDNGRSGRRDDQRDDRRDDDRNPVSDQQYNEPPANEPGNYGTDSNLTDAPRLPVKVSLERDKIYDNAEFIGTYTQSAGTTTGEIIITVFDPEKRKIATAHRTNGDWKLTMVDDVKLTTNYNRESPLVGLFTFIVEKEYL